jgi:glycosyltransferase involved in cell wall biosynthesis
MNKTLQASILIPSYNYGRFLKDCIDSALAQTYANTEVIVVDDGSTDNSREIIEGYGKRITSVLKTANAGAKATYNAACALCKGDVILFLDSDDMICPTAIERAMEQFGDSSVVKVHWPLWIVDGDGRKTGRVSPSQIHPDGDLREEVVRNGPFGYISPPTSGNAFARRLLEKILPMPRGVYVDDYPSMWALVLGTVKSLAEPHGCFRVHARNNYGSMPFDDKLRKDLRYVDLCCDELGRYFQERGIVVDTEIWKRNSWHHRISTWVQSIRVLVPQEETFILVDGGWVTSGTVGGRRALPFLEHDGQFWGLPPDDETAIRELERMRQAGSSFMIFVWSSFWWLNYYAGLNRHLRSQFRCVLEDENLIAFDIREYTK